MVQSDWKGGRQRAAGRPWGPILRWLRIVRRQQDWRRAPLPVPGPRDKVAEGKTGTMTRAGLKKEFEATDCGGLKCRACPKLIRKGELEEICSRHIRHTEQPLRFNTHQAAVAGATSKKTGGGLMAYLKPRQPTMPGPGPREGDEGGAAALPAAARGAAGAAPAGPGAHPGTVVMVLEDEDCWAEEAAGNLISTFKNLPAQSQTSVAQQITMLSTRYKHLSPPLSPLLSSTKTKPAWSCAPETYP